MKNKLFIFCVFISLYFPMAFAQQATTVIEPDLKYGRPSKEELALTAYAPDPLQLQFIYFIRVRVALLTMMVFGCLRNIGCVLRY